MSDHHSGANLGFPGHDTCLDRFPASACPISTHPGNRVGT
jgi:hypothetical protein